VLHDCYLLSTGRWIQRAFSLCSFSLNVCTVVRTNAHGESHLLRFEVRQRVKAREEFLDLGVDGEVVLEDKVDIAYIENIIVVQHHFEAFLVYADELETSCS